MVLQWLRKPIQILARTDSIYDVIYLNYLVSKIFGMSIYTIGGDFKNRTLAVTRRDVLAFLRLLILQAVSFYVSFAKVDSALEPTGSNIMDIGRKYTFTIGSLYVLLLAVSSYGSYRPLQTMLIKMNQFDEWAKQINAPVCHRAQKRRIWQSHVVNASLLTVITTSSSVLVFEMYQNLVMPASVVFSFVCSAVPFVSFVHHLFVVGYLVYYRLNHLNETLVTHFVPPKKSTTVLLSELPAPRSNRNKLVVLQQLQLQWSEISQVVELIGKTYFRQIIVITITMTVLCTFSLFVFYRAVITQEFQQELTAIVHLEYNVYFMFLVVVLIWVFDGIKQKGKRTGVLVHKALRESSNDRIRDELLQFSSLLGHKRIVLNCYIFECDWTLGMSIISFIISYLVILIQFDASLVTTVPKIGFNDTLNAAA